MSTLPPSVPSEDGGPPAAVPAVPPPLPKDAFTKTPEKQEPLPDAPWWRSGSVPCVVLLLVAAAADFLVPTLNQSYATGAGTAIGSLLFVAALLLLRRDLSRAEQLFLLELGLITAAAQVVSASGICYFGLLVVPFILLLLPKESAEPTPRGRSWWAYWLSLRPRRGFFRGGCLPMVVSIFIGMALFAAFLGIFAGGNPVVELVWNTLEAWWNKLLEFLHLDWDLWFHVLVWGIGAVLFGLYTMARPHVMPRAAAPAPKAAPHAVTMLPHLPLITLLSVNAAFLVATSTDIAFLWFRRVPEGISQTAYLHEGADSITFASVLAALILLFLFRRNGSARQGAVSRAAGYLLVLQTLLLAVSVFMRLFFQISDYGFTFRRVLAGECLLMGLVALGVLLAYMAGGGQFLKHLRRGFCVLVLFFFGFNIEPPTALAGDLNVLYAPTHPHWKFDTDDFRIGRFEVKENLAFAAHCVAMPAKLQDPVWYDNYSHTSEIYHLRCAAEETIARSKDSWRAWTLRSHIDLPAARYLLKAADKGEAAAKAMNEAADRKAAEENEAENTEPEQQEEGE